MWVWMSTVGEAVGDMVEELGGDERGQGEMEEDCIW